MRIANRTIMLLLLVALAATACSGGSGPADDAAERSVDEATDDPATDDEAAASTETDPSAPADAGSSEETSAPQPDPVYGGELSFLVEGETSTWDLPNAECATSCINVLRLTSDPLFVEDETGRPRPFLLAAASADDSLSVWTLTLRAGISFQNGQPVDADALALDLEHKATGFVTGPILGTVDSIVSDGDLTVTITFANPHSSLPSELASLPGFLMAPEFWGEDHDRSAGGPIGTGPFVFDEWIVGERTSLVRNDTYWRTDADGRSLPYVDRVEIRPVPSKTDREAIIQANDASLAHVDDVETPSRWLEDWDGGLLTSDIGQQTSYGMFNSSAPPFDDPDARLAVALCTDRPTFNAFINPGSATANGPFAPGSVGHLDDSGFPDFDQVAGSVLVDALGGLTFEYLTTNDSSERLAADLLVSMWRDCGIDVTFAQLSQAEVITRSLVGNYEIVSWRLHGATNPAVEFIWWHSTNAEGFALNAGRIRDDRIDAALEALRATEDPDAQRASAEEINRLFGEGVYNLWFAWSEWWIIHQPDVHGVGVLDLPDGGLASPKTHGDVWLHQAWIDPT